MATIILLSGNIVTAGDSYEYPGTITDTYQLDFGSLIEAFPGETDLLIPIYARLTEPAVSINVLMVYDPSLLTPFHIAPNMFFQSFIVDHEYPGRIGINIYTNLPPPPQVPPIEGDTIIAWIQCRVTTEDIGYDLLTHFTFFEDPVTPYPDNNILLENGGWVVTPTLSLVEGDVLIISPLYGDINVNGYAFEIGDAITFLHYFMGQIEFTRRQYANSDCNRDGIQASIADLVYLLGVISGDTLLDYSNIPEPIQYLSEGIEEHTQNRGKFGVDSRSSFAVNVECMEALGGAYFGIEFDPENIGIESVELNPQIENLDLSWTVDDGTLMVAIFDWNGRASSFREGDLFTVYYNSDFELKDEAFRVERAEFSSGSGFDVDASYRLNISEKTYLEMPESSAISIAGYPNPFNGYVTISYELPHSGNYDLVIFDILGREVKTLMEGYKSSGGGVITWDGVDNQGDEISSGIYFARLRGETVSANIKLILMK
jgi:hypothetical protein